MFRIENMQKVAESDKKEHDNAHDCNNITTCIYNNQKFGTNGF